MTDDYKRNGTISLFAGLSIADGQVIGTCIRSGSALGMQGWESTAQFFAAAAEAMRRILIEQARRRSSPRRGGGEPHFPLEDFSIMITAPDEEILAVHEALDALAAADARAADLVKLRFFAGMSMIEAAEALDKPLRLAERLWTFARARLRSIIARSME